MNKLVAPPNNNYVSPSVEVIEIEVEKGFANSYGERGRAGNDFGEDDYYGGY